MLCILEHHFPSAFEIVQSTDMKKNGRKRERRGERQDKGRKGVRGEKVGDKYKLAG